MNINIDAMLWEATAIKRQMEVAELTAKYLVMAEALEMILDLEPDKMHDAFNIALAALEKVRNDPPF